MFRKAWLTFPSSLCSIQRSAYLTDLQDSKKGYTKVEQNITELSLLAITGIIWCVHMHWGQEEPKLVYIPFWCKPVIFNIFDYFWNISFFFNFYDIFHVYVWIWGSVGNIVEMNLFSEKGLYLYFGPEMKWHNPKHQRNAAHVSYFLGEQL